MTRTWGRGCRMQGRSLPPSASNVPLVCKFRVRPDRLLSNTITLPFVGAFCELPASGLAMHHSPVGRFAWRSLLLELITRHASRSGKRGARRSRRPAMTRTPAIVQGAVRSSSGSGLQTDKNTASEHKNTQMLETNSFHIRKTSQAEYVFALSSTWAGVFSH